MFTLQSYNISEYQGQLVRWALLIESLRLYTRVTNIILGRIKVSSIFVQASRTDLALFAYYISCFAELRSIYYIRYTG